MNHMIAVTTPGSANGLGIGVSWPVVASWSMAGAGLVLLVLVSWQLFRQHARARREEAGLTQAGEGSTGGGGGAASVRERMEAVRRMAAQEQDLRRVIEEARLATAAMLGELERAAVRLEALIEAAGSIGTGGGGTVRESGSVEEEAETNGTGEDGGGGVRAAAMPTVVLAERVAELSARGRSPVQIAQELNQQVGTVELILALRRT